MSRGPPRRPACAPRSPLAPRPPDAPPGRRGLHSLRGPPKPRTLRGSTRSEAHALRGPRALTEEPRSELAHDAIEGDDFVPRALEAVVVHEHLIGLPHADHRRRVH